MPTKLKVESVDHLAVVMKNKNGHEWAPRNGEALVLGTKAGAAQADGKAMAAGSEPAKKSRIIALLEKVKSWYTDGPVVGGVADKIDGDGDGDNDYNSIVALFTSMYYDMQSAVYISDDDARSAAVVALVDNFLAQLDAIRGGSDSADKAGARHSAADKAAIAAIGDAHTKLGKALEAATKAHEAIGGGVQSLGESDGSSKDDASAGDDASAKAAAAAKSAVGAAIGSKADDEPYGDVEYADPGYQDDKKKRYPIDTKEHANSAWSYINKESNASKYSADDLAKVKAKIKTACEKFGVDISEDNSKAGLAEEIDMTQEQIDALVAKAASEAANKAVEAVKAELQPQIDAAKAEATQANADAEKAKADAAKAQSEKEAAEKAGVASARSSSGSAAESQSDETRKARSEKLHNAVKAALGANPIPTRF